MPQRPTYRTETTDTGTVYHCLYCEAAGSEHHATDLELFTQHMHQRHDGRMIEESPAAEATTLKAPDDHPHGGPPGQTGTHPEHPHGGPPGQTGEPPEEGRPGEEPEPTHPIVLPDEDTKPDEGT